MSDAGPALPGTDVLDVNMIDRAIKLERRFIEVIQRYRRAEVGADVEAVVGGEQQRRADRHFALCDDLAIDPHGDIQRAGGLEYGIGSLDFDPYLARGELLLARMFVR